MTQRLLHGGLAAVARQKGGRDAVILEDGQVTSYATLDRWADRIALELRDWGVRPAGRVGVALPKSAQSVAAVAGILRAGAAYVPVDPDAPVARSHLVLKNCEPALVLASDSWAARYRAHDGYSPETRIHVIERGPVEASGSRQCEPIGVPRGDVLIPESSPAYVLHTSGSTGPPKGVVVSHRAAMTFVRWAAETFRLTDEDRLASIAPLHFDLSVFDLFAGQSVGATVVLFGEDTVRNPRQLAQRLCDLRVTTLYATPSLLTALLQYGHLHRYALPHLRQVLFAGEVFPVPRLVELMKRWPQAEFFNLFGPTETNVCTWYEVPRNIVDVPPTELPIGRPCPHYRVRVSREPREADRGVLLVTGEGLMSGYLNRPEESDRAFETDGDGVTWYRTGDIVSERPDGVLMFHGRTDRMLKRHGFRIEPVEIEARLREYPDVLDAAVVGVSVGGVTTAVHAFVVARSPLDLIALRKHCAATMPAYLIPNRFAQLDVLPRTSSGKTDLQQLEATAASGWRAVDGGSAT